MKKNIVLLTAVSLFLMAWSCNDADDNEQDSSASELAFKVSKSSLQTTKAQEEVSDNDSIIFTGDDLLWFNETTREIRFKKNYTIEEIVSALRSKIKIYVGDQFLFTIVGFITDINSEEIDEPVLYYNTLDTDELDDHKFYLVDGYPQWDWLTKDHPVQILRDENMKKIENEWSRFIGQLRKEGKYKK